MKRSYSIFIVYFLCLFRIFMTIGSLFWWEGDGIELAIDSILIYFAITIVEDTWGWIGVIGVLLTLLVWLSGVVLALLGIRFVKARKAFVIVMMVCTLQDFLLAMINSAWEKKLICGTISFVILLFCILALRQIRSQSKTCLSDKK